MSKKQIVLIPAAERRVAALKIALKMARSVGARRVSLASVAKVQKVTAPLLFHIFKSREEFIKAIVKEAKKEGVVLPPSALTVRELREMKRNDRAPKVKKITKPAARPVVKPIAAPVKRASAKPGKAVAKKIVAAKKETKKVIATAKQSMSTPTPSVRVRKPRTEEQKAQRAKRDAERRAMTPAEKFKALPTPFEASLQQAVA